MQQASDRTRQAHARLMRSRRERASSPPRFASFHPPPPAFPPLAFLFVGTQTSQECFHRPAASKTHSVSGPDCVHGDLLSSSAQGELTSLAESTSRLAVLVHETTRRSQDQTDRLTGCIPSAFQMASATGVCSSKRARSPPPPPGLGGHPPPQSSSGTPSTENHTQIKKLRLSIGTPTSVNSSHSASRSYSSGRAPSLIEEGNTPSSHSAGSLSHGLPSPSGSDSFAHPGDQSSIRSHTDGEMDRSAEEIVASPYQGGRGSPGGLASSFKLGPPSSLLAQVSSRNHTNSQQQTSQTNHSPSTAISTSAKKRVTILSPTPSSPLHAHHQHLPLALLSHVFSALLVPRRRSRIPTAIPLPNFLLALSLVRSMLGSSSSLSPKDEIELRVLEGWVGLETGKTLLAEAGARQTGKEEWAERGRKELRETEVGLGKAVSDHRFGA